MSRRLVLLCLLAAFALPSAPGPAVAQTAANPSFNLVNRATVPIRELYFTAAGDANWGRNRLDGRVIAPGASYPARRRADGNCVFDIRVVFAGGKTEDRRGLNTCQVDDIAFGAAAGAAGKAADDPSFKLVNRGSAALVEAYANPSGPGAPSWGQNRLASPLPPQTDRLISLPKGECGYDLRVVFAGGRKLERRHANLCRITDLPVP